MTTEAEKFDAVVRKLMSAGGPLKPSLGLSGAVLAA
jgi:hypothetical protein